MKQWKRDVSLQTQIMSEWHSGGCVNERLCGKTNWKWIKHMVLQITEFLDMGFWLMMPLCLWMLRTNMCVLQSTNVFPCVFCMCLREMRERFVLVLTDRKWDILVHMHSSFFSSLNLLFCSLNTFALFSFLAFIYLFIFLVFQSKSYFTGSTSLCKPSSSLFVCPASSLIASMTAGILIPASYRFLLDDKKSLMMQHITEQKDNWRNSLKLAQLRLEKYVFCKMLLLWSLKSSTASLTFWWAKPFGIPPSL